MDAEIRRLTYVSRHAGAKQAAATQVPGSLIGELPAFLRRDEAPRHAAKPAEIRLEAKIIELERALTESEQRSREALAAAQHQAAEERAAALREQAERLGVESAQFLQAAVIAFGAARVQYFADAESSVVRLALGIAARVLHREAQMDPLLLRGPVRVALEDAQQDVTCVLEVAAEKQEAWERWFASLAATGVRVEVRVRQDAAAGHCRLEIGASKADLGVDAQLAEIERGFFDLLQRRPSSSNEATE